MNDTEVDRAHGAGIVVDQSDQPHGPWAGDLDLLVELPAHGKLIGLKAAAAFGIRLGHVPSHPQRPQAMEPGLALRLAAGVTEDGIRAPQDDIRDDLLPARVVLDLGPGPVFHQLGNQQSRQIALCIRVETLKSAQPVQLGTGNDKHALA